MGYNTAVIICNDQLQSIADDPNFGSKLKDTILDTRRVRPRGHENMNAANYGAYSVGALPPRHADDCQLVLVGRNSIQLVGQCWSSDPLEAIRQVADHLGYDLRKKPERKSA